MFGELLVVIGVIESTGGCMGKVVSEIGSFAVAYAGSSLGELASVGVEGDGAFWVIIFESFRFWKAEAEFGGRVVG